MKKFVIKIRDFFKERFDTKNFFLFFRFIGSLFLIVIFLNLINLTFSRYTSKTNVNIIPKLAYFITEVGTQHNSIKLDSILPSGTPYLYGFTVSNFKDERKSNVNIEYDIEIVVTTNLPLNFKVYKNDTNMTGNGIITLDEIITNDDDMFFRVMSTDIPGSFTFSSKQTDNYILWVEFPEVYKNNPEMYEGVIELVEIKVNARQVV